MMLIIIKINRDESTPQWNRFHSKAAINSNRYTAKESSISKNQQTSSKDKDVLKKISSEKSLTKLTIYLEMEPNLLKLQNPLVIVGDIHGQFYDLIGIVDQLQLGKDKVLFLGDYVDRGCFSIEVIVILLCLKISWPNFVFLLRGNHECQQMTSHFNFRQQCLYKYDQEIYSSFLSLFKAMPLAATVDRTFLCLHGVQYISSTPQFQNIARINRFKEIPNQGLFCDLLWADPTLEPSGVIGRIQELINTERGCSYIFGKEVVSSVLKWANVKCILRGHQAEEQGYRLFHWLSDQDFPQVITIFSAPNYCDFYGNKASILKVQGTNIEIKKFGAKQHPFVLPDFMDVFEWSFPFVAEKVIEMMINLIQPNEGMELDETNDISLIMKAEIMKKFLESSKKITKENMTWTNIGHNLDNLLAHDEQAQQFLLTMEDKDVNFHKKRQIDSKNQKRPLYESIQF